MVWKCIWLRNSQTVYNVTHSFFNWDDLSQSRNSLLWGYFPGSKKEDIKSSTTIYNRLYYIDRSVLLKNTPLVKFIRNYIRDPSGVFSISSLVRILMTSFPALSRPFGAHSRWKMASDRFVYIIKRKLHGGLKIWILFSRVKNNILLTCCARS